jgi:pseudaminic acid biosynthesis-associated methylase
MVQREKSAQELFWAGEFGNEYTGRNQVMVQQRVPFFTEILRRTFGVRSVCELGTNRGHNLRAIAELSPNYELTGVEINPVAHREMAGFSRIQAVCSSIQEFTPSQTYDLVFTCGVLIHLNPDDLPMVYDRMMALSSRYILINEYFNPVPQEINYRGHADRLFKRDFAGELMDRHDGKLSVVDMGFLWKRTCPSWDDSTWFLLEKI